MNKEWTIHKQVLNKSWTSNEQVMNKSWKSHEQVIKKSLTSHEQVLYFNYFKYLNFSLFFITCSLKSQLGFYLWPKTTIPGGWVAGRPADGSTGNNTNSAQLSWSWGWGWAWQKIDHWFFFKLKPQINSFLMMYMKNETHFSGFKTPNYIFSEAFTSWGGVSKKNFSIFQVFWTVYFAVCHIVDMQSSLFSQRYSHGALLYIW